MKNRIKDYLIILIFAIIISIPLVNSNLNIYIDDGIQHIARLMGTSQSISEGQAIPVIMSQFCNNFGYSWNIFYSPLTSYIPLIFSIFTSSFELMLKLFMLLIAIASGIAMYEFVTKVTKNRYAGLLAAAIYIFAPYRLTDMYMRTAISELASFVFLPVVFHGMYNIFNSDEKSITKSLLLTLGAAGLILTHIVMAMYVAIFCFIYLLINVRKVASPYVHFASRTCTTQGNLTLLYTEKSGDFSYTIRKLKDKQVLKMLGINILLILLLTSFYTLPMLEHKMATDYEVFKSGRMERTEELIRNKVDFIDLIYTKQNNFSFEIGLVTIIGLVLTILAFKKVEKKNRKIYWFSLITGIICIILSLRFFPFEKLPGILKMIQFTFRLLEFSIFFFAFVAAYNFMLVVKNFNMKDVIVLSLIAFLLIVPLKKNLNYEKKWSEDKLWPAVAVTDNTSRVHAGCATFEYLPSKAFENLDYIKHRENKVYVLSGNATIENEEKSGTRMSVEVSNVEDGTELELPYIYYLGYDVKFIDDDGNETKLNTYESDNGFATIKLSNMQEGVVKIQYTGTILMQVSYVISLATFVCLIVALFFVHFYRKRHNRK